MKKYCKGFRYNVSDLTFWLYFLVFCALSTIFFIMTNIETYVFMQLKYGFVDFTSQGTMQTYLKNSLWFLAPELAFGIFYSIFAEFFGRRWAIALWGIVATVAGCAIHIAIKQRKIGEDKECLSCFSPYILIGAGTAFFNSIYLSLLAYISHPNALGSSLGFCLSWTIAVQQIYMAYEGNNIGLEKWQKEFPKELNKVQMISSLIGTGAFLVCILLFVWDKYMRRAALSGKTTQECFIRSVRLRKKR